MTTLYVQESFVAFLKASSVIELTEKSTESVRPLSVSVCECTGLHVQCEHESECVRLRESAFVCKYMDMPNTLPR